MKRVSIEAIHHGLTNRKRPLVAEAVTRLAESIALDGLLNPVTVREIEPGTYRLLAGRHRLEACKKLGWTDVPVTIKSSVGDGELDGLHDELSEVDENLIRTDLGAVHESVHLRERKRIVTAIEARRKVIEAERLAAKEKAETGKVSKKTQGLKDDRSRREHAKSRETAGTANNGKFTRETAQALNKSESEVRKGVQRGDVLVDVAAKAGVPFDKVAGTQLDVKSELDALTTLAREFPSAAIDLVRKVAAGERLFKASKSVTAMRAARAAESRERGNTGTAEELVQKELAACAQKAGGAIRTYAMELTLAKKAHEADRWFALADELYSRATSHKTGTQYKTAKHLPVPLGNTPKETAQREQAKKDQAKNARKHVKRLQPKSKPVDTQMEDAP